MSSATQEAHDQVRTHLSQKRKSVTFSYKALDKEMSLSDSDISARVFYYELDSPPAQFSSHDISNTCSAEDDSFDLKVDLTASDSSTHSVRQPEASQESRLDTNDRLALAFNNSVAAESPRTITALPAGGERGEATPMCIRKVAAVTPTFDSIKQNVDQASLDAKGSMPIASPLQKQAPTVSLSSSSSPSVSSSIMRALSRSPTPVYNQWRRFGVNGTAGSPTSLSSLGGAGSSGSEAASTESPGSPSPLKRRCFTGPCSRRQLLAALERGRGNLRDTAQAAMSNAMAEAARSLGHSDRNPAHQPPRPNRRVHARQHLQHRHASAAIVSVGEKNAVSLEEERRPRGLLEQEQQRRQRQQQQPRQLSLATQEPSPKKARLQQGDHGDNPSVWSSSSSCVETEVASCSLQQQVPAGKTFDGHGQSRRQQQLPSRSSPSSRQPRQRWRSANSSSSSTSPKSNHRPRARSGLHKKVNGGLRGRDGNLLLHTLNARRGYSSDEGGGSGDEGGLTDSKTEDSLASSSDSGSDSTMNRRQDGNNGIGAGEESHSVTPVIAARLEGAPSNSNNCQDTSVGDVNETSLSASVGASTLSNVEEVKLSKSTEVEFSNEKRDIQCVTREKQDACLRLPSVPSARILSDAHVTVQEALEAEADKELEKAHSEAPSSFVTDSNATTIEETAAEEAERRLRQQPSRRCREDLQKHKQEKELNAEKVSRHTRPKRGKVTRIEDKKWSAGDHVELFHRQFWWPATVDDVIADGIVLVGSRRDLSDQVRCDIVPCHGDKECEELWQAVLPHKEAARRLRAVAVAAGPKEQRQ